MWLPTEEERVEGCRWSDRSGVQGIWEHLTGVSIQTVSAVLTAVGGRTLDEPVYWTKFKTVGKY